ncbi:MAG: aminotransferase class V-fold PLP-dependent enzyme [Alphaproteobacteria bacterium]|nr:aminotransferase class V-fold PLP-dependent enzyme [Alphaproteobacteria bacterium]
MKENFPIFSKNPNLRYFDSAATALKPQILIDVLSSFYAYENGPVHRAGYALANTASDLYENAREIIATYLGTQKDHIAFTSGATDGLNKLALYYRSKPIKGILTSEIEHHSNFLPWMALAQEKNIPLHIAPYHAKDFVDLDFVEEKLKSGTVSLIALSALSNVLGQKPDLKKLVALAHQYDAKIIFDGTQHICHNTDISLPDLDCDYYVFSGHKLYGPTGVGVLYIKDPANMISPFLGGGMISDVQTDSFTPEPFPQGWEAGTPVVAQAIGLAAVVKWLSDIDFSGILQAEEKLLTSLKTGLENQGGLILGSGNKSLLSCRFDGVSATDLASLLGMKDVCVRAGKHCAHPLHCSMNLSKPSLRFSLGMYNTKEDVDATLYETEKALGKLR